MSGDDLSPLQKVAEMSEDPSNSMEEINEVFHESADHSTPDPEIDTGSDSGSSTSTETDTETGTQGNTEVADDDAEDNPFGADHTLGTGNSPEEDVTQPIEDLAEATDEDDDANDGSFANPEDYFRGGSDADGDGENETTSAGNEVVDSNDPVEFLDGEADGDQQETDATPSNPTGDESDGQQGNEQPTNEQGNESGAEPLAQLAAFRSLLGGSGSDSGSGGVGSLSDEQLMLGAVAAVVVVVALFGGAE